MSRPRGTKRGDARREADRPRDDTGSETSAEAKGTNTHASTSTAGQKRNGTASRSARQASGPRDRASPDPSDEELLRRFNHGDAEAFASLVQRYERPLYNFVLRSVRRRDRADELFQDVLMRVVQRSDEFKGNSKVSTWIYAIARNLCIDHSRKMVFRRHRSLDAPTRAASSDEGPSLLDRTASSAPDVDRAAMRGDLQKRIAEAVEELPDEQREVFLMRHVQGLAFREIAEIIDVPENTVKSRMRYALERLQRALAQYREYARELK